MKVVRDNDADQVTITMDRLEASALASGLNILDQVSVFGKRPGLSKTLRELAEGLYS